MCKRASFLAIRGGKVAWLLNSDSHEDIVKAEGLKDDEIFTRKFVRIECVPNSDPFSLNPLDWKVKEDEEELPSWYDREEWVGKILDELIEKRIPEEKKTGTIGNLELKNGIYVFDWLATAANIYAYNGSKLDFPLLATAADIRAYNGSISAPLLGKKSAK